MLNRILAVTESFRTPLRVLATFSALAAAALLSACFYGGGEDDPHTVPAGKDFESVQLEIQPDGAVLLLVSSSMHYKHKAPVDSWDSVPQTRNYESILYRRSSGGWTATSFKNLQSNMGPFPILLEVPGLGFQALVDDYGGPRRYALGTDPMVRRPLPSALESSYWGRSGGYGNTRILSDFLLTSDTSWLLYSTAYLDTGIRVEVRESGFPTRRIEGPYSPRFLHATPGYRCLVAREYVADNQPGYHMTKETGTVALVWKPGADKVERHVLDADSVGGYDSYVARYKDGYAYFGTTSGGIRVVPLDPDGRPGIAETIEAPEGSQGVAPLYTADAEGCLVGLETLADTAETIPRLESWNTCHPEDSDVLELPAATAGRKQGIASRQVRVAPDGRLLAAFVLSEYAPRGNPGGMVQTEIDGKTLLVFAERTGGKWRVETVEAR